MFMLFRFGGDELMLKKKKEAELSSPGSPPPLNPTIMM